MAGFLQALTTTPLHDRMLQQGRLLPENTGNNFNRPNFRTFLPLPVLLQGLRQTLLSLYSPSSAFYNRAYRSLVQWETHLEEQKRRPIRSCSPSAFWPGQSSVKASSPPIGETGSLLVQILARWLRNPPKLVMGMTILLSGHHFIKYAQDVAAELEAECRNSQDDFMEWVSFLMGVYSKMDYFRGRTVLITVAKGDKSESQSDYFFSNARISRDVSKPRSLAFAIRFR